MSMTASQVDAAFSRAQRAYDDQLPEDDLDFLDTPEGEDFEREEEEALMQTGCGRVIDAEQLWAALSRRRDFRAIRDEVINELMKTASYKAEACRLGKLDAQRRNEP